MTVIKPPMKIVLTGGAGFIGSHVTEAVLDAMPEASIVVLDKMSYAADFRNLARPLASPRFRLIVGDICDLDTCATVTRGADLVIHLAAESHVDNSFGNSLHFTHTNVLGTHALVEACRVNKVGRVLHVSTDEVYGDILDGSFDENSSLNPTNPYSASKAAAEMVIRGYMASFQLPVIMVRGNNIYGTRQFPEKIIPKFCMQLHRGMKLTVHGDGRNVRSYLSVHDFAAAILRLVEHGTPGEVYNVGTHEEFANLHVAALLCERFGSSVSANVTFVTDRPFNDRRYSVDTAKIGALGWAPRRSFETELDAIVAWYREHAERYVDVELGAAATAVAQVRAAS